MDEKTLAELLNLINSCNEHREEMEPTGNCCFCNNPHYYGGHNPAPVVVEENARCCDYCNIAIVLKARLEMFNMYEGRKYTDCECLDGNCDR